MFSSEARTSSPVGSAHSTSDNGMIENNICQSKGTEIQPHSHNHMTLFTLYVQHVFVLWPEADRPRQAFSLEQAEILFENHPQYLAVVQAVKENNLHLLCT